MHTPVSDPAVEFESELRIFDSDVDEVVQCFYIWRTVHAAARRSRKVYDMLNRNSSFWNVALGSIQANSLIALGRIFDKDPRTHNVKRLLKLAEENPAVFSKNAVRERKSKILANNSSLLEDYMRNVHDPSLADFKRLQSFVDARRKVYERCYKHLRDRRYAHRERTNISGFFAQTDIRELAQLVTDLSKLHRVLWDWQQNGIRPRTSRLRGKAGKQIRRDTLKFVKSLVA
jgi:hypothetical protein